MAKRWYDNKNIMWVDNSFMAELKDIEAERIRQRKPKMRPSSITSKIVKCPSFKSLKNELINDIEDPNDDINFSMRIKFDKRRLTR